MIESLSNADYIFYFLETIIAKSIRFCCHDNIKRNSNSQDCNNMIFQKNRVNIIYLWKWYSTNVWYLELLINNYNLEKLKNENDTFSKLEISNLFNVYKMSYNLFSNFLRIYMYVYVNLRFWGQKLYKFIDITCRAFGLRRSICCSLVH